MPIDFSAWDNFGKRESPSYKGDPPSKSNRLNLVRPEQLSFLPPGKEGLTGIPEPYRFDEFDFQPKLGQDNYKLRAQYQSTGEQLLKTIGNTIVNIPLTILEGVGYVGELFSGENDYDNGLVSLMDSWKNPFGEVYRENPDEVFDLGDPAWWFNNAQSVLESAGAFAFQGAMLGKLFMAGAKGLSTAANLGAKGITATRGAAQVLTAGTLAYTEGAMSGRQVYKEIYDEQFRKLSKQMDPISADQKAREFASKGAAATVRLNTAINTVFNRLELDAFFGRSNKQVQQWMKANGKRVGETDEMFKARWNAAVRENPELKKALSRKPLAAMGIGALAEGAEEVNTQYAEETGREIGGIRKSNELGLIGDYFDKITNQEGALNFILGAFGGVAQTAALENLPLHRVLKYDANNQPILKAGSTEENPVYETRRVSSRTRDAMGRMQFFENAKDAVAKDIEWFNEKRKAADKAAAEGDKFEARKINDEIFNVAKLRAVASGNAEVWEGDYRKILELDNSKDLGEELVPQIEALGQQVQQIQDPAQRAEAEKQLEQLQAKYESVKGKTAAMAAGFAVDQNDNEYKEKAKQAISDLKWMTELREEIYGKYVSDDVAHSEEYAQYLLYSEVDNKIMERNIQEEERAIEREAPVHTAVQDYHSKLEVANRVRRDLEKDRDRMQTMLDRVNAGLKSTDPEVQLEAEKLMMKELRGLLAKYKIDLGVEESGKKAKVSSKNLKEALDKFYGTLNKRIKQHSKVVEDMNEALLSTEDFKAWKEFNPDGTFREYQEYMMGIGQLQDPDITLRKARVESSKTLLEISKAATAELRSKRGIEKFIKAAAADKRRWKEREDLRNARNRDWLLKRKYGKEKAAQVKWQHKVNELVAVQTAIGTTKRRMEEVRKEIEELEKQLKEVPDRFTFISKRAKLKAEIKKKTTSLKNLSAKLETLEARVQTIKTELEKLKAEYEEFKDMEVDDLINEPDAENVNTEEEPTPAEGTPPVEPETAPTAEPTSAEPTPGEPAPPTAEPAPNQEETTVTEAEKAAETITAAAKIYGDLVAKLKPAEQAIVESVRQELIQRGAETDPFQVLMAIKAKMPSWKGKPINVQVEQALSTLVNETLNIDNATASDMQTANTESTAESTENTEPIEPLEPAATTEPSTNEELGETVPATAPASEVDVNKIQEEQEKARKIAELEEEERQLLAELADSIERERQLKEQKEEADRKVREAEAEAERIRLEKEEAERQAAEAAAEEEAKRLKEEAERLAAEEEEKRRQQEEARVEAERLAREEEERKRREEQERIDAIERANSEEKQAETVTAAIETLEEDEKKTVDDVYEANRESGETKEAFVAKAVVAEQSGEELPFKGDKSLLAKFKAAIRKIIKYFLSLGVIGLIYVNTTSLISPKNVVHRTTPLTSVQVSVNKDSVHNSVFEYNQKVYPGTSVVIVDKLSREARIYDANGNILYTGAALIGATENKDTTTAAAYDSYASFEADNRATPSGHFVLSPRKDTKFGAKQLFVFRNPDGSAVDETGNYFTALHAATTPRLPALNSPSRADNNVTFGCVSISLAEFSKLEDKLGQGTHIYVIPDTDNRVMYERFLNAQLSNPNLTFREFLQNSVQTVETVGSKIGTSSESRDSGKPAPWWSASALLAFIRRRKEAGEPLTEAEKDLIYKRLSELNQEKEKLAKELTQQFEPIGEPTQPVLTQFITRRDMAVAMEPMIAEHTNAQTERADKVNRATIEYIQTAEGEMGKHPLTGAPVRYVRYSILPLYEQLDKTANHSTLIPGFVSMGDELDFIIDEEFDGMINLDKTHTEGFPQQRPDKFTNHVTAGGKIVMNTDDDGYANVPIKIVHRKSGQVIGYLPRLGWVTAQFENAINGRNIRDVIRDVEGNVIEDRNIEKQANMLKEIRRVIAEAYNQGRGPRVYSASVDNMSPGYLFLNMEYNERTGKMYPVAKLTSESLPDPDIEFVISNAGVLRNSRTTVTSKVLNRGSEEARKRLAQQTNVLMAMIPMPDGTHSIAPLEVLTMSEIPADLSTINWVLEAYLAYNTDAWTPAHDFIRKKILETTSYVKDGIATEDPLDITDEEDLEKFIEQYFTYSRSFGDHNTQSTTGKNEFLFQIGRKGPREKALIKIGVSNSGTNPRYARLVNGKLDPEFVSELTTNLGNRHKIVNYPKDAMRGINDTRPFRTITFSQDVDQDGLPRAIESSYPNYNAYLKLFTKTFVYGKHRIDPATGKKVPNDQRGGKYVYGANPVINFDHQEILDAVPPASSAAVSIHAELGIPTGPRELTEMEKESGLILQNQDSSKQKTTANAEDSIELNLPNLRTLLESLPEEERNGKTPKQVLREMEADLFTSIPPGLNPFKKC